MEDEHDVNEYIWCGSCWKLWTRQEADASLEKYPALPCGHSAAYGVPMTEQFAADMGIRRGD